MQTIFDRAHAFVAQWEGGFINHPSDPGGATNYGVSLRWLRSIGMDIDGDGDVDIDDIKALTPQIAKDLFRVHFWQASFCDSLPPLVAVVVYDGAVNMGPGRAARQLQAACNRFPGAKLAEDGVAGPKTRARVKGLCGSAPAQLKLCLQTIAEREAYYQSLARDSRYRPFLKGWLNRTKSLREHINTLAAQGVF